MSTKQNPNTIFIPSVYRETRNGIEYVPLPTEMLRSRRAAFLVDDVTGTSMAVLLQSLMWLDDNNPEDPVDIYINSPGGDVSSAIAVYRYITEQMRSPVRTYCIGTAASAAALIYLAGSERYIYNGCTVMIHDPSSISSSFEKSDQIKDRLAVLDHLRDVCCEIIATRTGHTIEEISQLTRKDTYFSALDALRFGISTKILTKGVIDHD